MVLSTLKLVRKREITALLQATSGRGTKTIWEIGGRLEVAEHDHATEDPCTGTTATWAYPPLYWVDCLVAGCQLCCSGGARGASAPCRGGGIWRVGPGLRPLLCWYNKAPGSDFPRILYLPTFLSFFIGLRWLLAYVHGKYLMREQVANHTNFFQDPDIN